MCAVALKPLIAILLTTLLSRVSDMVAAGEIRPLIDPDTPLEAHTELGQDGNRYDLVFSDEFETEGREFGPGKDPYWEAADMHYYATNDLEYYHPDQITTKEGSLVITLEETDPATNSYGLSYKSGMLTGWNK